MFRHNNFARGLCLSIVALTATMCLYNVSGGDELIKKKEKPKKQQYPTFPDQYLPTPNPLERTETLTMVQQNFHFSAQAQYPSLGFVTAQEIQNTTNKAIPINCFISHRPTDLLFFKVPFKENITDPYFWKFQ